MVMGDANPANGVATFVWLGFGAVVTALIRRLALRGPDQNA